MSAVVYLRLDTPLYEWRLLQLYNRIILIRIVLIGCFTYSVVINYGIV